MTNLEKLRFLKTFRRTHWGLPLFRQSEIVEILSEYALPDERIDSPAFSNALNGKQPDSDVFSRVLSRPNQGAQNQTVHDRIEALIGIPGFFACADSRAICNLIGMPKPQSGGDCSIFDRGSGPEMHLTQWDEEARSVLLESLSTSMEYGKIRICDAAITSGPSIPALGLASLKDAPWNKIAYLRPTYDTFDDKAHLDKGDLKSLFAPELEVLARQLGADPSADALYDAIEGANMLVVVLSGQMIDLAGSTSLIKRLFVRFGRKQPAPKVDAPARVLVIGDSDYARDKATKPGTRFSPDFAGESAKKHFLKGDQTRRLGERVFTRLNVPTESRLETARSQWGRFAIASGIVQEEDAGARMNYVADYMRSRSGGQKVRPIDVKMHVFFAANRQNFASFDPTYGFSKLVGMGDPDRVVQSSHLGTLGPIPDIESHYRDLIDLVFYEDFLARGGASTALERDYARERLRVMRAVSTGIHWLSGRALELLGSEIGESLRDQLKRHGLELDDSSGRMDGYRYHTSLALRAVVQEHWRDNDELDRSDKHYKVAEYMWYTQHDKAALRDELPFVPNRGRHRMYFLCETIRHLVRCVEGRRTDVTAPSELDFRNFPEAPGPEDAAPYANRILDFCFVRIFMTELQGGAHARLLSRRYGTFGLTVELLQLMSAGGQIGTPHPALNHRYHAQFVRECGLALLEHGRLEEAATCFANVRRTSNDWRDQLESLLDLSIVFSIWGAHGDARALIERARDGAMSEISQTERNSDRHASAKDVHRRAVLRWSHLLYLTGQWEDAARTIFWCLRRDGGAPGDTRFLSRDALQVLNPLLGEEKPAWPVESEDGESLVQLLSQPNMETAFVLISALRRMAKDKLAAAQNSKDANNWADAAFADELNEVCLGLAIKSREMAANDGRAHEAMGMNVIQSRLWRDRGSLSLSEQYLDIVQQELLNFGSSERTYLAFLNEAGDIVMRKGEFIRAYVTYLRPCYVRAKSRRFTRDALRAAEACVFALGKMRDALENDPDAYLAKIEKTRCVNEDARKKSDEMRWGGSLGREAYARDAFAYHSAPYLLDNCKSVASLTQQSRTIAEEVVDLVDATNSADLFPIFVD